MQLQGNTLALVVDDRTATYPITIDPLSTTAAARVESNQDFAEMGYSVASAGDVNGDGYSDVIVGAPFYDNGQTAEGAAFVYHGSAGGISTTAAAQVESDQADAFMGWSVASAGDVNADGYSDVIVGAYLYDNGESNEGSAFVYHGSAGGISTTAAAQVESNQDFARMGQSVASAGDVNGDGYSDVIVGALFYDNGQDREGAAFVYHGSAAGISTTAAAQVESDQEDARMGRSVASAGDVNGDGYSDVIVGAQGYNNGQDREGAAFVYHGSAAGISTTAAAQVESNQADANMGISVASAGDVNGDGYSDVIVGAPFYNNGQTAGGAAFVYHGSATGISTTAAAQVEGDQAIALMGWSVASAGDVNGDGYSDVIVGAYLYANGQSNEGAAFVYHGSASGISTAAAARVESNQAFARMGVSVASAGDVNGDGYSDVIVGAQGYNNGQSNEGAAFVYHGSPSGISTTAAAQVESNQADANMGISVASAGDVNGDGYSDVIVGAYLYDNGQTNEGAAFVYHGSATGISTTATAQVESNQDFAEMGYSVASAGDVNADGYSDVIVGAPFYDNGQSNEGAAFVYHGSATGISTTAAARVESDQEGALMGNSVASAGDVNGDGYSDVIVGAYLYDNGESDEGSAFVYHGSASGISTTAAAQVESNQENAFMGRSSVASAGDVNGDGYSDVIVGAPFYDNGQSQEGAAFVYHGNAGGGLRRNARAFNTNTTTPIQQSNATASDFSLGLFSKNFLGSTKGKLVWEIKQQGEAFSSAGGSIANSVASTAEQGSFTNLGTSGTQLANAIDKAGTQTKVRVRVRYDPVTAITGQVYGPWQYLPEYTRGAQGMSSTPLLLPLLSVAGNIKWSTDPNQGVKDATVTISGNAAGSGDSDADGNYSIDLYSGGNLTVTPVKNINKFNGVTAADATRIQQHVTGNPLLGAPYPRIAADVNKNNSISVQDASLIKQALLGNQQANTLWNTSWRFVDADYVFLNPNVPWNFPESIALNGVNSSQTDVNFTGIKLGDVTTPAANPALRPEPLVLRTSDQRLQSGQIMAVPVSVEGFAHVAAFQFVLHFDADALALQHISTPEGGLLSLGDFGTYDAAQGEIRTVFAQPQGAEMTNGDVFFTLHFTPLQSGAWLSEAIHLDASLLPAEAYTPDMEVKPIDLVFSQSSATGQLHDPKPALRAIPNPANDQTRLHFTLPVADEAFIRVMDLNGKVLLAQRARYDAGAHVLPMTFTQTGVYMAELRTARGVEVVKIVVE